MGFLDVPCLWHEGDAWFAPDVKIVSLTKGGRHKKDTRGNDVDGALGQVKAAPVRALIALQ